MQKKPLSGSILIWSIFLSMFLALAFLTVSTRLHATLKNNAQLQENIHTKNEIADILKKWEFQSKILPNNTQIIFEKNNQYISVLAEHKKETIRFFWTWATTAQLKILQWSPLQYKLYSFPSSDYNDSNRLLLGKWNLTYAANINIPLTSSQKFIELEILNLWWYSKFILTSPLDFTTQYKKYKIMQKIWNKKIIKSHGKIKNF